MKPLSSDEEAEAQMIGELAPRILAADLTGADCNLELHVLEAMTPIHVELAASHVPLQAPNKLAVTPVQPTVLALTRAQFRAVGSGSMHIMRSCT